MWLEISSIVRSQFSFANGSHTMYTIHRAIFISNKKPHNCDFPIMQNCIYNFYTKLKQVFHCCWKIIFLSIYLFAEKKNWKRNEVSNKCKRSKHFFVFRNKMHENINYECFNISLFYSFFFALSLPHSPAPALFFFSFVCNTTTHFCMRTFWHLQLICLEEESWATRLQQIWEKNNNRKNSSSRLCRFIEHMKPGDKETLWRHLELPFFCNI